MSIKPEDAFKASSQNISSIFGTNGEHYYLPAYQRPYSWDDKAVRKLIIDVLSGLENLLSDPETYSFCGSIITVTDHTYATIEPQVRGDLPGKVQLVIDGQQRLTTLLLFCVVISNRLSMNLKTLESRSPNTLAEQWLIGLGKELITELERMLVEPRPKNGNFTPIYPRMTRAFKDQWSKTEANQQYVSAIAEICHTYASLSATAKTIPYEYQPVQAADDAKTVTVALNTISEIVDDFSLDRQRDDEDFSLPLSRIVINLNLLTNVGINVADSDLDELRNVALGDDEFSNLIRLVIFGNYLLKRVVLAKIICQNENYAFDVFEALNTSGTELDATETFPPLIIKGVGLKNYGTSSQKVHLDRISYLLEKRQAGNTRQEFAKNIVITFALAESGEKISKRRSEQQKLLAKYARSNSDNTNPLVENFRRVADLSELRNQNQPEFDFGQISASNLSDLQLAFKFFKDLNHDIVLAPLSRFYAETFLSRGPNQSAAEDFVSATKAAMAFSVLWRCKNGGADGIDSRYRSLMSGDKSFLGLARDKRNPIDIVSFKNRLTELLNSRFEDKKEFISTTKRTNFYKAKIAKVLLLASHHDAAIDPTGKLTSGVAGLSEFLTYRKYMHELTAEIEHIAPQNPKSSGALWDNNIYDNDVNTIHFLGNLTVVPKDINWTLGNHDWAHKKVLIESLCASTQDDAQKVFDTARDNGIDFPRLEEVEQFVRDYIHVPQFVSLSRFANWDEQTINSRTENLLGLAYDRLYGWLK